MSLQVVERPSIYGTTGGAKRPRAYPARWAIALLVGDVACFTLACALGAAIGFHHWESGVIVSRLLVADAFFVLIWIALFDRLGLYRRTYALSIKDELYYTIAALILGVVPQLVLFTLYPGISTSRLALLYALGFSVVLVGGSRSSLHHLREQRRFGRKRRTSIVGTIERINAVVESMDLEESETLLLAVDDVERAGAGEWFDRARRWGCDAIILTEVVTGQAVHELLEVTARDHISLAFAPPRITRSTYDFSLQTAGRQALIVPTRLPACTPRARAIKRAMDVVLASIALLIFAPVMLVAAVAVYLDSGRPIFYLQERVGRNGRTFSILKFRSMRIDAERELGAVWAKANDPRTTRVGAILRRFSIDEMPQLFNVLRGEMSLVGPRPERPVYVDRFRATLPRYDDRHLVAPGITGWSQIHMKRVLETSAAPEKLEYDLQYVENWSPYLDISVLFQTLCEFLFHKAA